MTDITADFVSGFEEAAAPPKGRKLFKILLVIFGIGLAVLLVSLKIQKYGDEHHWQFLSDLNTRVLSHWVQWREVIIFVLEGAGSAAALTIAFNYVVMNTVLNMTKIETSEELNAAISGIRAEIAASNRKLSSFEQTLANHRERDEQTLKEFLAYAEAQRNAQLKALLEQDREKFDKIADVLAGRDQNGSSSTR